MRVLTVQQIISWCRERAIEVASDGGLYFGQNHRSAVVQLPEKPYQVVALANSLLPYSDTQAFEGGLLWIKQWGVWNELVERAGLRIIELLRRAQGDSPPLEDAPGHLFSRTELVDLQVCFLQPLLIGWDAVMVPESGDYIVATSHDGIAYLIGRTEGGHRKILEGLEPWGPFAEQDWKTVRI